MVKLYNKLIKLLSNYSKRTLLVLLIKVLGLSSSFLLNVLYAKYFGKNLLGEFILVTGVLIAVGQIALLGTNSITIKILSQNSGKENIVERKKYFSSLLLILLISSLVVSFCNYFFANQLENIFSTDQKYLKIISLILPFYILSKVLIEVTRAHNFSVFYSFMNMLSLPFFSILIFTIFNILLEINISMIDCFIISTFMQLLLTLIFNFQFIYSEYAEKTPIKMGGFSKILKQSIPLLFAQSLMLVMQWIDQFMLGYFMDEGKVAVYFTAVKIATLVYLPAIAFNTIIASKIPTWFFTNQIDLAKNEIKKAGLYSFILSIPLFIILFFGSSLLLGLHGDSFEEGESVIRIILISQMFNSYTAAVGYCLELTGHQNKFLQITLYGCLINVILNYLLIPIIGLNGAAIATALALVLINFGFVIQVKKIYKFWPIPFIK